MILLQSPFLTLEHGWIPASMYESQDHTPEDLMDALLPLSPQKQLKQLAIAEAMTSD